MLAPSGPPRFVASTTDEVKDIKLGSAAADPSLISFTSSVVDATNLGGPLGASISAVLLTALGFGSYVLLLIATTESIRALFFEKIFNQHLWIMIHKC